MRYRVLLFSLGLLFSSIWAQPTGFDFAAYSNYLNLHENIDYPGLATEFPAPMHYYSSLENSASPTQFAYWDSIKIKLELTAGELGLLKRNHFVVSERLSEYNFGSAYYQVFGKDLPVMVTTDFILHGLHQSYDKILLELEIGELEPHLHRALTALRDGFSDLAARYAQTPELAPALQDVDVYLTIAMSLLENELQAPSLATPDFIRQIWIMIEEQTRVEEPLFTTQPRIYDFSQFTVRGHYDFTYYTPNGEKNLGNYFKAMMWMGQIDFVITQPPGINTFPLADLQRQSIAAMLLNELIFTTDALALYTNIDDILQFMVGDSDNLTPHELQQLAAANGVSNPADLLDPVQFASFQQVLKTSAMAGQQILSNIFILDPFSTEPDTLPVSYRVMGQRFVLDSYVLGNLVFPNIVYQQQKIWRPMPDPLDAMFALGNVNALPLLAREIETYHYGRELAGMNYLTGQYDESFWEQTLYNTWLDAIRQVGGTVPEGTLPQFMQTTAWQQEKLNTQLASWAELRHDNLLYAKQSYTGGTSCFFPHSFVEPYPEFYAAVASFSRRAEEFFSGFSFARVTFTHPSIYFKELAEVTEQLAEIAAKELTETVLTADEDEFLKNMMDLPEYCGTYPYEGWINKVYFDPNMMIEPDYIVADVHTQPTDLGGAPVGHVLHVGTGKVNLGIFLATAPNAEYAPVAFVGPVMSYYQTITKDFYRYTDAEWAQNVQTGNLPERPDWVNIYLADGRGTQRTAGRELSGARYSDVVDEPTTVPQQFQVWPNYPNPFNPETTIRYYLPEAGVVRVRIHDMLGREVSVLLDKTQAAGTHQLQWDARDIPSGIYFCQVETETARQMLKLTLLK